MLLKSPVPSEDMRLDFCTGIVTTYFSNIRGWLQPPKMQAVQGDQAAWTKPPVDIDLKLCFSMRFLY